MLHNRELLASKNRNANKSPLTTLLFGEGFLPALPPYTHRRLWTYSIKDAISNNISGFDLYHTFFCQGTQSTHII